MLVRRAAPPLTPLRALEAWHLDLVGIVVVALATVLYLRAVRTAAGRGVLWPAARSAIFVVGLAALLVATAGWVGRYAGSLFWVYTVQLLVLLLLSPLCLAFGRPLALARLAADRPGGWSLPPWLDSPLLGPALVPLLTAAVYFTPLLGWSVRSAVVGAALRAVLLVAGLVFALPLAGDGSSRTSMAVAAALFVGFLELLLDAVPGIALRLHGGLLDYFTGLHRSWGPSPLSDQHRGGSILWTVAEVLDLPFLVLLVVQWIRVDEAEAARTDRLLDEQEAEQLDGDGRVRPWWEASPADRARGGRF